MDCLVDTSVLVRLAVVNDPLSPVARNAVRKMTASGDRLLVAPQCLIEFRNVATRPTAVNGLGWTAAAAEAESDLFESMFHLLPDSASLFPEWKTIVKKLAVTGAQVHDARLFAMCIVTNIDTILTFNTRHFVRFQIMLPALIVLDPRNM
jgi:predicted nucleic acid-binding protein